MNEAWLDIKVQVSLWTTTCRDCSWLTTITDGNYDKKSLWYWGDVKNQVALQWPDGTDFTAWKYGRYIDIPLKDAAKNSAFITRRANKGDDIENQVKKIISSQI